MIQEFAYGILPLYKNLNWEYELLIVKKKSWLHRAFTGWHVEFWESPLQAAYRELHEESWISDIDVDEKTLLELHYTYTNKDRLEIDKYVWMYIWFVKNKNVQLEEQELMDYKRLTLPEAINEVTYPSSKDLVQKVINYLKTEWYIS